MKSDTLTAAAAVFVIGLLLSGLGVTDMFSPKAEVPSDLQRGFQGSSLKR
ncbi:hypothetical protein [Agaribacterium haliotis]|nr:hypothetical protein [Agaribacterium haliotis]